MTRQSVYNARWVAKNRERVRTYMSNYHIKRKIKRYRARLQKGQV